MAKFKPTRFMAEDSKYNKKAADYAVSFIECLSHTKGTWAGKKFELLDWQEQIIRDLFGILKPNGYRQFNTAYIEIPKKNGKSELAAAVALLLTCGDGEQRAEVYGAAADRQQASIVFDVAAEEYGSEFYANGASPSGVLEHPGTLDEEGGNLYLVNGSMTKLSDAGAFAEKNNEKEENTNGEKVLELEKSYRRK